MFINRRGRDGRIFWTVGRAEAAVESITTLDDRIVSQRDDHKHALDRFLSNSISLSEYISGIAAHTNLWILCYLFCHCQYFPI